MSGDGLFTRKGSPYYYCHLPLGNGKYKQVSTGKTKYKDAKRVKEDALRDPVQAIVQVSKRSLTLQEALEEDLAFQRATKPESTAHASTRSVAKVLMDVLGAKQRLGTIANPDVIRKYQEARSLAGRSPKTVNNEVTVLRRVLTNAELWGHVRRYNPLRVYEKGPGRSLTPEEGDRLIQLARSKPEWCVAFCAMYLAHSTGCRRKEIRTLQLEEVRLESRTPHLFIPAPKAKNRKARTVVLPDDESVAVTRLLLERAKLLGANVPEHYVLPANLSRHTKSNDPLHGGRGFDPTRHQMSWETSWNSLRAAAGLPTFRFHDLRHTFITHAIEGGATISWAMAQVGHLSEKMTRHYTHLSEQAARRAVDCAVEYRRGALGPHRTDAAVTQSNLIGGEAHVR